MKINIIEHRSDFVSLAWGVYIVSDSSAAGHSKSSFSYSFSLQYYSLFFFLELIMQFSFKCIFSRCRKSIAFFSFNFPFNWTNKGTYIKYEVAHHFLPTFFFLLKRKKIRAAGMVKNLEFFPYWHS